jgi:hypothetical protein
MNSSCDEVEFWGALRCHSTQTLQLADSLAERGLCGWTPRVPVRRRLPRQRKVETKIVAVLPSFVFVPFEQLERALDLGLTGTVPRSRPFTFNDSRPVLPRAQLDGLRLIEHKRADLRRAPSQFRTGETVRLIYGHLHGQQATVVKRKGRDRWIVEVNGASLSVPGFLLQEYKRVG